ncbi:hypothetical protein HK097_003323 [Rhizophlyctis rosea]|uniref:Thioesterase n=1 Tax=Rhizophlyctis rosea TaxID=64517 RepID=A0AAD5SFN7_9FUNG|nr:hypothetical protein HK097_003323 [Rhizophlyctis rosea]
MDTTVLSRATLRLTSLLKRLASPKFLLLVLFLANIRSAPFAHHIRFFAQIFQTQWSLRNRKRVAIENGDQLKVLPPYDDFWASRTLHFRVFPDDVDWNIHMNNSHYYKNLDFARTDFALAILGKEFMKLNRMMNAGVVCFFKKELKPLQKFRIVTRLLSYGPKWMYIEHRFVSGSTSNPTVHTVAISKVVLKQRNGKTIPFAEALTSLSYVKSDEDPQIAQAREEKRGAGWKAAEALMTCEEELLKS